MDKPIDEGKRFNRNIFYVHVILYVISTLVFFLACSYETHFEKVYGSGWHSSKSVSNQTFFRMAETNNAGTAMCIVCFVIMTILFILSGYCAFKREVKSSGSLVIGRPLILMIGLIVFYVFIIVSVVVSGALAQTGRSFGLDTGCYGDTCFHYGDGYTYSLQGGAWWTLILWAIQLVAVEFNIGMTLKN